MTSVILASASQIRLMVLKNAGVSCDVRPADIDETGIKQAMKRDRDFSNTDLAALLARSKAISISQSYPAKIVIGADQILECETKSFDKPENPSQARDHLLELRGKTHSLISAVCCALDGEIIWSLEDEALLTMRDFSNEFLGTYLASMGDDVMHSVGGYKIEGLGLQLFEEIKGDYFTILGLPLLPLLAFLRSREILLK